MALLLSFLFPFYFNMHRMICQQLMSAFLTIMFLTSFFQLKAHFILPLTLFFSKKKKTDQDIIIA